MKFKNHTLGTWFDHLLFKLLPPEWYLRTQGVELHREPRAMVTITYELHGRVKTAQIELLGGAWAVVRILPLWLKHGFIERAGKSGRRYAILPHCIREIAWYDPVLKDYFSVS